MAWNAASFFSAFQKVDVFTLSFNQGLQKPDPAMVEQGITTLLVPPLLDPRRRRLHHDLALAAPP